MSSLQPLAERFRDTCGVDPAYVANFGEEVARGQPVFIMSQLLKVLEPMLRESAGVAPWQVCCPWPVPRVAISAAKSVFCNGLPHERCSRPTLECPEQLLHGWPTSWALGCGAFSTSAAQVVYIVVSKAASDRVVIGRKA